MTPEQKNQCGKIIHSSAVLAGAGNLVPIPGLGFAADTAALTTMAVRLAGVFGSSLTRSAGKAMALAALKRAMLQQPIKMVGKEVSKLVPVLGQLVAPTISVAILETTGWALATELAGEAKLGS